MSQVKLSIIVIVAVSISCIGIFVMAIHRGSLSGNDAGMRPMDSRYDFGSVSFDISENQAVLLQDENDVLITFVIVDKSASERVKELSNGNPLVFVLTHNTPALLLTTHRNRHANGIPINVADRVLSDFIVSRYRQLYSSDSCHMDVENFTLVNSFRSRLYAYTINICNGNDKYEPTVKRSGIVFVENEKIINIEFVNSSLGMFHSALAIAESFLDDAQPVAP